MRKKDIGISLLLILAGLTLIFIRDYWMGVDPKLYDGSHIGSFSIRDIKVDYAGRVLIILGLIRGLSYYLFAKHHR